jgi:hypothetical protein
VPYLEFFAVEMTTFFVALVEAACAAPGAKTNADTPKTATAAAVMRLTGTRGVVALYCFVSSISFVSSALGYRKYGVDRPSDGYSLGLFATCSFPATRFYVRTPRRDHSSELIFAFALANHVFNDDSAPLRQSSVTQS